MKKFIWIPLLVLTFSFASANEIKSGEPADKSGQTQISWEQVQVVYDLQAVDDLTAGEQLSETIRTSLNFGTKERVKKNCLKELKKQAASKGYSVIYIHDDHSKTKRFNKRGIEVTLVGTGYSS